MLQVARLAGGGQCAGARGADAGDVDFVVVGPLAARDVPLADRAQRVQSCRRHRLARAHWHGVCTHACCAPNLLLGAPPYCLRGDAAWSCEMLRFHADYWVPMCPAMAEVIGCRWCEGMGGCVIARGHVDAGPSALGHWRYHDCSWILQRHDGVGVLGRCYKQRTWPLWMMAAVQVSVAGTCCRVCAVQELKTCYCHKV